MVELEINGVQYRGGTMPAKQQFHIARRLAPILTVLAKEAVGDNPNLLAGEQQSEAPPEQDGAGNGALTPAAAASFFGVAQQFAEAVRDLSDKDCDYVIDACMGVVQRKQGDRYVAVWNKSANMPQFSDIDLPTMMQLTVAVIQDNLGSFMPAQAKPGQPPIMSGQNAP